MFYRMSVLLEISQQLASFGEATLRAADVF